MNHGGKISIRPFPRKASVSASIGRFLLGTLALGGGVRTPAIAQVTDTQIQSSSANWKPPVKDTAIFAHVLFDELEGRSTAAGTQFRWDGQAWIGNDMNKLWVKSEGFLDGTTMSDGDHEFLYDRPIPRMRYFDAQVGVRTDLDSDPKRAWAAIGIEGLAPYEFEFAPTFYIRNDGRVAGRVEGSYEFRLRQRLVTEPQAEVNFYGKDDAARKTGSGFSDIDGGLRLRYELTRKLAPYIGYTYSGAYGNSATYQRQDGESTHTSSFVFGIRVWH
jgi:copper resistance protein B